MAKYPIQHEQTSEVIHVTRDEVTSIVREELKPVACDVREVKAALLGDLDTPGRGVLPRLAKVEETDRMARKAFWTAIASLATTLIGTAVANLL